MTNDKAASEKGSNTLFLWIFALVLAILPFGEEPHLLGKIRWVAGGAVGMKPMDWFDLLMHGLPITALIIWQVRKWVVAGKAKSTGV